MIKISTGGDGYFYIDPKYVVSIYKAGALYSDCDVVLSTADRERHYCVGDFNKIVKAIIKGKKKKGMDTVFIT